jgi:hypothetical protein
MSRVTARPCSPSLRIRLRAKLITCAGASVLCLLDPVGKTILGQLGKIQEEVLRIAQLKGAVVELAVAGRSARWRFQRACCSCHTGRRAPRVAAVRAGALHVTIGQETVRSRRIHLCRYLAVEIAVVEQSEENVLRDLVVVRRIRVREEIIAESELLEDLEEAIVVIGRIPARRPALGVSSNSHRRAVAVAAGNHEDAITAQPVVTGVDIGGK